MSSGAADLNLLFGIMAVQNDFVSRAALIEAMGAWVRDKSKTLSEAPNKSEGKSILLSLGCPNGAGNMN